MHRFDHTALITCLSLLLCTACDYFVPKEVKQEEPIARVGQDFLFESDLEGLILNNISKEDSQRLTDKYIDDWILKQLMIRKSTQEIDVNEAEIERKVLDYRYALVVQSYIRENIRQNLDHEVSPEEIEAYYMEKSDNFLLTQHIVKCSFLQIPKSSPNLSRFKRNFRSFPEKNQEEVISYVTQFATKTFLDDSLWVIFDDVIINTPLEGIQDKGQFLKTNKYSETSDDENTYFLKIHDFLTVGEISPIEFIEDDILNIIINKRKIVLKEQLEERIYEEAKEHNAFEVFDN